MKEGINKIEAGNVPEKSENLSIKFGDSNSWEINTLENGELRISLTAGEKEALDFSKFIPENFKFVDHKLASKLRNSAFSKKPNWCTNFEHNFIEIGPIESPKEILMLLHELGHVKNDLRSTERMQMLNLGSLSSGDVKKQYVKISSVMERRAWAYAVREIRMLKKNNELDLKAIFPNFRELKNYIDSCLYTYREDPAVYTLKDDPSFEKEIKKLYDRWQYAGGGV